MTTLQNEVLPVDDARDADSASAGRVQKSIETGSTRKKPSRIPEAQTSTKASRSHGERSTPTKADIVLKKLRSTKGATVNEIMQATGWQAHSVRGFLSVTVKKKLNLTLSTDIGKDGARRYRISNAASAG